MKSHGPAAGAVTSPVQALRRLLNGALTDPDAIKLVTNGSAPPVAERDFHRHDIYEIFCPLAGDLVFQPLGFEAQAHPPGSLLAGKLHAVLTRPDAKGRDWYDSMGYVTQGPASPPAGRGDSTLEVPCLAPPGERPAPMPAVVCWSRGRGNE